MAKKQADELKMTEKQRVIRDRMLVLICEDKSVEEMAKDLKMAKKTVENRISLLLKYYNKRSKVGLAVMAIKSEIYKIRYQ